MRLAALRVEGRLFSAPSRLDTRRVTTGTSKCSGFASLEMVESHWPR